MGLPATTAPFLSIVRVALAHPSPAARAAVAAALGDLGLEDELERLAEDPEPFVRIVALSRLTSPSSA